MIYNILVMLVIEYYIIVGFMKVIFFKVVLIFFVVISIGIGLLLVVFFVVYLCLFYFVIIVVCLLIMGFVLVVLWRICIYIEDDIEELVDIIILLNFLSKNKMFVFYMILIFLGIIIIIVLDVVCFVVY